MVMILFNRTNQTVCLRFWIRNSFTATYSRRQLNSPRDIHLQSVKLHHNTIGSFRIFTYSNTYISFRLTGKAVWVGEQRKEKGVPFQPLDVILYIKWHNCFPESISSHNGSLLVRSHVLGHHLVQKFLLTSIREIWLNYPSTQKG